MKKVLAMVAALALAMAFAGCSSGSQPVKSDDEASAESSSAAASSAGSASAATGAIKDDPEEAERQLAIAMQYLLEDAYGDKVNDFRITSTKFFTAEEEQADETLADYNLGPNEVAFSVEYELHPAEGVDVNELTAATGQYDEASGWVTDKGNIGILRPNPDGDEPAYVITDFGTGF